MSEKQIEQDLEMMMVLITTLIENQKKMAYHLRFVQDDYKDDDLVQDMIEVEGVCDFLLSKIMENGG